MKVPKIFLTIAVITLAFAAKSVCQSNSALTKNNPYSPSPSGKGTTPAATPTPKPQVVQTPVRLARQQLAFVTKDNRSTIGDDVSVSTETSPTIEANAVNFAPSNRPATEIYRIGVGDVLFINLKNSPQGSGYYTVRDDGMIDYPLAGPDVLIVSKTTDETAAMLRSTIKLYANPQVEVRVQHYLSRSFFVEGLADNPGEKVLRREAMPVFAIRAEGEVRREATTVRITRAATDTLETYPLADATTDNVLVLKGDRIEFVAEKKTQAAYYTFGRVRKPLVSGAKLSQAINDNLGAKAEPKRAVLRRTNASGVSSIVEHDIKAIRQGKALDPVLASGDVIEIKN